MSLIETLLEAAEYVDNVETTKGENKSLVGPVTTNAKSKEPQVSNGVIKHWRKRAVAQSVLESQREDFLQKKSLPAANYVGEACQEVSTKVWENGLTEPTIIQSSSCEAINQDSHAPKKNQNILELPLECRSSAQTEPQVAIPRPASTIYSAYNPQIPGNTVHLSSDLVKGQQSTQHQMASKSEKLKNQSVVFSREAHNLLEKNRRAHLKECFDNLRSVVPSLGTRKVSNLVILREALTYVQALKNKEQKQKHEVESLAREKISKQEKLALLRSQLASHLEPDAIEEILRHSTHNDGTTSPSKPSLTDYNTSTASEMEDSDGESAHNKQKVDPLDLTNGEAAKISSHPEFGNEGEEYRQPNQSLHYSLVPQNVIATTSTMFTPLIQFSHASPMIQGKHGMATQAQIWNGHSTMPTQAQIWNDHSTIPTGFKVNVAGKSDAMFSTLEIPQKAPGHSEKQETLGQRPKITGRIGQISANNSEQVVICGDGSTISATVHRIPNVKPYKRVITGHLPNFLDPANGVNPLKIVVKSVESAKQHARASKNQMNLKNTEMNNKVSSTAKPAVKPRQTELIFRPRSSMTPPPPSKIIPYFPRFSVGSGGSPPLTTIMPNLYDASLKNDDQTDQEKQEDALMSQNQITMWRQPPWSSSTNIKNSSSSSVKRKISTGIEFGNAKLPKQSSVDPLLLGTSFRIKSQGSSQNSSQAVNSDTDSETETKMKISDNNFTTSASNIILRPALSSILSQQMFNPVSQNKSVTQVCYSTLSNASKPTIPSASALKNLPEPTKLLGTASTAHTSWSKATSPQMSLLNTNVQMGAGNIGGNSPQVAYQILPTILNQTIMQSLAPGAIVSQPAQNLPDFPKVVVNSQISEKKASSPSCSTLISTAPTKGDDGIKGVTLVQQPSNMPQAQIPQIQYVIPMGYTGMLGGAPQQVGFSPTMGGFMPVTPVQQGQGWSYVLPQNMVFAQNNRGVTMVNIPAGQDQGNSDQQEAAPSSQKTEGTKTPALLKQIQISSSEVRVGTPQYISTAQYLTANSNAVMQNNAEILRATESGNVQSQIASPTKPTLSVIQPNGSRSIQPQFQIVSPNMQAGNQIVIPMGAANPGGGYIFGGAVNTIPTAQNVATIPCSGSNIGYSLPIMGYSFGASPVQIAAMPNGAFQIPRGMACGIPGRLPTQIMTLDVNKQNNQGGSSALKLNNSST